MLYAYLDASKTEIGKGMTVVAGYLASLDEWGPVEAEWKKSLEDWKIPRFHHAELNWLVGYEKHDLCLRYFENIIRESELVAVGCVVQDENWEMRPESTESAAFYAKKYSHCLGRVLELISKGAGGEDVAVICDSDDSQDTIFSVFREAQRKHPNLANLTIGSMDKRIPLQSADLVCAWLRHVLLAHYRSGWKGNHMRFVRDLIPTGRTKKLHVAFGAVSNGEDMVRMINASMGSLHWRIRYTLPDGRVARLVASPLLHFNPDLKRN